MVFKPTINQEVLSLTATDTKQSVTLASSYAQLIISCVGTSPNNAIRVSINGSPVTVTGTAGFLVLSTMPLMLDHHQINTIDYIRDSGAGSDVAFSLIGMWH